MTTRARALRFGLATCVVISVLLATGTANAAIAARAVPAAVPAVTTGSWAATLVKSDGTVLTGSALTVSATTTGANVFFSARNTGGFALTGETFTLSSTGVVLGTPALEACSGGTYPATTCTGGTAVAITSGTDARVAIPVGGSLNLKLTEPVSIGATFSISVSVARADVRAATITNS